MLAKFIYKHVLEKALRKYRNGSYMEIGSFDGEGISSISKRHPERAFYSIDPFIEDGNTTQKTNKKRGQKIDDIRAKFVANTRKRKNIVNFDMTTKQFIDKKLYVDMNVSVLFIDGDHTYKSVLLDLSLASLLATNNKVCVVMDDVSHSGVKRAIAKFRETNTITKVHYMNLHPAVQYEIFNKS